MKAVGLVLALLVFLSGCASDGGRWVKRGSPDQEPQVQRQVSRTPPIQVSPIVGAVAGGIVGNQFGKGRGKTVMTIAGAVVGAEIASQTQGSVGSQYGYGPYGSDEHPAVTRARNIGLHQAAQKRLREAEDAAFAEGCTEGGGCDGRSRRYYRSGSGTVWN